MDAARPGPAAEPALIAQVTALVKTFERPGVLRRLVGSIRRLYPGLRIVVVDDSRMATRLEGVQTIEMPYDTGISAGRNEGIRHVTTPYVFLLDDDFVLSRRTRLAPAVALMERHPEIDVMGGHVIDLPFYRKRRSADGFLFPTDQQPRAPIGTTIGGLEVRAKVPNYFLARTDRLATVGWDSRLKLVEHADFFTRALGVLTTVLNPRLTCLHARTPFAVDYRARRDSTEAARAILADKWKR